MKINIKSIYFKLIISYSTILLLMTIIFIILYSVSRNSIESNTIRSSQYLADIVGETIDAEIGYTLSVSDQIYNSSSINTYVNAIPKANTILEKHYNYVKLLGYTDELTMIFEQNLKETEVILYIPTSQYQYYSFLDSKINAANYEMVVDNIQTDIEQLVVENDGFVNGYDVKVNIRESYDPSQNGTEYLYFYKPHRTSYQQDANYYIIMGIPKLIIEEMYDSLVQEDNEVFYLDTDYMTILQSQNITDEFVEEIKIQMTEDVEGDYQIIRYNNEKYICITTFMDTLEWTQYQIIPISTVLKDLNEWTSIIAIGIIVLIFGLIIAITYLNSSIVKPIKVLDSEMQLVKEGKEVYRKTTTESEDEIGRLSMQFYDMVTQIDLLQKEMLLNEKQKRDLEIESLQAQINPHFIYNTIGAIKILVQLRRLEQVSDALIALTEILKNTVSRSDALISLEEEVKILQSYIEIQSMRYGEFQFEILLPDKLKTYHILRFLIQPLVENSLLHGYETVDKNTHIRIEFTIIDEEILRIIVQDNGLGMSKEQLERIITGKSRTSGLNGIGLNNIVQRIKLNYKEPFGISFESSLDCGTSVVLKLPLQ